MAKTHSFNEFNSLAKFRYPHAIGFRSSPDVCRRIGQTGDRTHNKTGAAPYAFSHLKIQLTPWENPN